MGDFVPKEKEHWSKVGLYYMQYMCKGASLEDINFVNPTWLVGMGRKETRDKAEKKGNEQGDIGHPHRYPPLVSSPFIVYENDGHI